MQLVILDQILDQKEKTLFSIKNQYNKCSKLLFHGNLGTMHPPGKRENLCVLFFAGLSDFSNIY